MILYLTTEETGAQQNTNGNKCSVIERNVIINSNGIC